MSYSIKGLTPSTNYFFKIQAKNSIGYGPFSPTISIKTLPGIRLISNVLYSVSSINMLTFIFEIFLGGIPNNDGTSLKGIMIFKIN